MCVLYGVLLLKSLQICKSLIWLAPLKDNAYHDPSASYSGVYTRKLVLSKGK